MAIEGIDYQFLRSEDAVPTQTTCELIEVTTALACAAGDYNLAVQVKTGIGRFFADLKKPPYKTIFNTSTSGAKAFNATITHRGIEQWIERKKKELPKKSGPDWGVLVHGNRILASAVFANYGNKRLSQPISAFETSLKQEELDALCEQAYKKMVDAISTHYSGKVLAVLFKNPTMSKHVFEIASS
jgi:hypothetical protein